MNRYMTMLLFAAAIFTAQGLQAQELYKDSLFSGIEKHTLTYYTKPDEALKLDLFLPSGNEAKTRPLMLYVHGGGFSGGKRDHENHVQFCRHMAAKGYVTATMSYTLHMKGRSFGCDQPAPNKIQTFLKTARDINRAAAFLISKQQDYRIDTNKIVLLGSSAGAEAVLHAAYWNAPRKDENGRILSPDFAYGGVVSMAGAITDLKLITANSAIPTQLFHGTCDNLVPYGKAPHHYCPVDSPGFLMLYGAHAIMKRLQTLGKAYYLVTGCYGRHEWNITPILKHTAAITDFMLYDVVKDTHRQIHWILPSDKEPCPGYNSWHFCR